MSLVNEAGIYGPSRIVCRVSTGVHLSIYIIRYTHTCAEAETARQKWGGGGGGLDFHEVGGYLLSILNTSSIGY